MTRAAALAICGALIGSVTAHAQSITGEVALSAGASTDDVTAAAVQTRAFGELTGGIRYFVEAAWARTSDTDSDAFSSAYPYANRVQVIEAYGERLFNPDGGLVNARAGRFRTPFGIYNASDHAYSGFLRSPLVRYDGYYALSNTSLEHGASVTAGVPNLNVEAAFGAPADVGVDARQSGLDSTVRVQGYYGPLIAGVSYTRSRPIEEEADAGGHASFAGVDARFNQGGVQVRGEWITGEPYPGASTSGWYVDLFVHRAFMGPVTAVARIERLDFLADEEDENAFRRRQTIGARIRILEQLAVTLNVLHQTGFGSEYRPTALDVGVSWTARFR